MAFDNSKEVAAKIRKLYPLTVQRVMAAVNIASLEMDTIVRTQYITNETSDNTLKNRSGNLKRSMGVIKAHGEGEVIKGGISFGSIYAKTHIGKKGQVNVIKGKPWLTIPMTWIPRSKAALETAGGVQHEKSFFKNTFIRKTANGNLIIFGQTSYSSGKRAGQAKGSSTKYSEGNVVPLFLLRKQVKVPVRIPVSELFARVKPKLQSTLNEMKKLPI